MTTKVTKVYQVQDSANSDNMVSLDPGLSDLSTHTRMLAQSITVQKYSKIYRQKAEIL